MMGKAARHRGWIAALAEIAEQHMIGWPTMMTLAQREAGRRERELARAAARALGAEN
jgi:ferrochelatase